MLFIGECLVAATESCMTRHTKAYNNTSMHMRVSSPNLVLYANEVATRREPIFVVYLYGAKNPRLSRDNSVLRFSQADPVKYHC